MSMQIGSSLGSETVNPTRNLFPCENLRSRLRQRLDFLEDVGLDSVEISPDGLNLIKDGILDKKEASSLLDILASYDFSYVVHAPMRTSLASPTLLEISEKIVRSCIDFSNLIDASVLTMHSGYTLSQDRLSEPRALRILVGSLAQCAAYATEKGVSIGIENGDMGATHICRRTDKLVEVAKNTGKNNVGITLDFSHLYISANYYMFDFMDAIKVALPYMIHSHLSDNFGKFDPVSPATHDLVLGYGAMHLPIGWGCIPYRDVVKTIKKDYRGIYLLEFSRYAEYYHEAIEKLKGFFI